MAQSIKFLVYSTGMQQDANLDSEKFCMKKIKHLTRETEIDNKICLDNLCKYPSF